MSPRLRFCSLAAASLLLTHCTSTPVAPEPAWLSQPTRTVDAGYIVYVGKGQDVVSENARFKAQSEAMSDLANECSFIPKGARIEDQFEKTDDAHVHWAYAKVGITFEECEEAKKAIEPAAVKQLANVAMTEQLKKLQDMIGLKDEENGEETGEENSEQNVRPEQAPEQWVVSDDPSYFLARQRIAWHKQHLILAPAGIFAPGAPQTLRYVNRVSPLTAHVRAYETAHAPAYTSSQGWSNYRPRPNHLRFERRGVTHGPRANKARRYGHPRKR